MSEERKFSAGQLLGEGIRRLGREELISLALEICADAADCGAEYHGNIHPGNISRGEGGAALGPRADHAPGEWSTDELPSSSGTVRQRRRRTYIPSACCCSRA